MRLRFLFFLLVLVALPAAAEVRSLTLRQAVALAIQQNPDLLIARFDEVKAQQAVREARDPFLPKVIVGSGLAYSNGFPLSIEGSAPSIVRADARQTLFSRELSYRAAKAREEARGAGIDLQGRREDAALRAANLFLDTSRATRMKLVAERQAESLERVAEVIRVLVAEGRELDVEAKKIAARVAQAKHRAASMARDVDYLESSLALVLGFPPQDRARPVDDESAPVRTPADEDAAVAAALATSKELKSLESKMQASMLESKSNAAARLPKVDLVAQYGLFARFNNYDDFFRRFQRNNGQLGVSIQVPIVAGPAAQARQAQADSESARLRLEMNHRRNSIALSTRRAYQDIRTAESLREVAKLDFEAARAHSGVILANFEEGKASLRQMEEARFDENEKWILYLDAQHNLEKRRLALLKETGDLIAAVTLE